MILYYEQHRKKYHFLVPRKRISHFVSVFILKTRFEFLYICPKIQNIKFLMWHNVLLSNVNMFGC